MTTLLLVIPNLGTGGAQNVFREQLQFYSKHYKTIAVVFNWDGSLPEDHELGIISLDVPAGDNVFSKAGNFFKRIRRLRAIKAANNITHSISHLEGADYVNILSGRGESIFCWLHGTKVFDLNISGSIGALRKKILIPGLYKRKNVNLVAVSEGIRDEMISHFKIDSGRIVTIVNGFDIEAINQKGNETSLFSLSMLGSTPRVITHCRLAEQKNLFNLINIFALLKDLRAAKFVIVGDGELRDQLVSHAESKGLSLYCAWRNNEMNGSYDVYFTGRQANPFPLLAEATLFVMSSSWEGFPLSLGEAMATGVPCVSADCFTGPREILAPGLNAAQPISQPHFSDYGVLMPLADSLEHNLIWADTINRVLNDQPLLRKYSAAGVSRIGELDQNAVKKKWLGLITSNE